VRAFVRALCVCVWGGGAGREQGGPAAEHV